MPAEPPSSTTTSRRPVAVVAFAVFALLVITASVLLREHQRGRLPGWRTITPIAPEAMQADALPSVKFDLHAVSREPLRPLQVHVLEDGADLGAALASPEMVRERGGGASALRDYLLFFSSRDGTDPRANGRHYAVARPTPVPKGVERGLTIFAILCGIAAAVAIARLLGGHSWPLALSNRLFPPPAPDHRRAVLQQRTCLAIALIAIAVRLVAIALVWAHPERHLSGALIMGVPFSDAMGWDELGESLMAGHGLAGGWSARRPFLAFVIGALYTWSGPMPAAVIAMNVLLCGSTAALVCRIGQRVFHPLVGAIAGLAFAFDAVSIEYSYYVLTETLGTFLFVLSVDLVVAGAQQNRATACWWSGVTFALSNLTRTLTLPAAPLFALAALFAGWRHTSWRRGLWLALLFSLGMGLPLGAWLVRQHHEHGLWTISDNTASGLYAAAAERHGSWNSAVDTEADAAGIPPDIKSRYDWFMQRFREELSINPSFYRRNMLRSAGQGLDMLAGLPVAVRCLLAVLLLTLWLSRLPRYSAGPLPLAGWLLVLAALACIALPPSREACLAFAAIGAIAAIVQHRDRLAALLLGSFAVTIAAAAAFALCGDPRLLLMVSWMLPMALANCVLFLFAIASRAFGDREPLAAMHTPVPVHHSRWALLGTRTITVALTVSLLIVAWRNFVSPLPHPPGLNAPSLETARAAVAKVEQLQPGSITPAELADPMTWYRPEDPAFAESQHGRLVTAHLRLNRHCFRLPADVVAPGHYSRMFVKRGYDRVFAYAVACVLPGGAGAPGQVMLPAPAPDPKLDILVVGRASIDRSFVYEESYLEVLAWAPLDATGRADLDQMRVAASPAHLELVRALRR